MSSESFAEKMAQRFPKMGPCRVRIASSRSGFLFHVFILSMLLSLSAGLSPVHVQPPMACNDIAGFPKTKLTSKPAPSMGLRGGKGAEVGNLNSWTFTDGADKDGDPVTVFRHGSLSVECDHQWSDGGERPSPLRDPQMIPAARSQCAE